MDLYIIENNNVYEERKRFFCMDREHQIPPTVREQFRKDPFEYKIRIQKFPFGIFEVYSTWRYNHYVLVKTIEKEKVHLKSVEKIALEEIFNIVDLEKKDEIIPLLQEKAREIIGNSTYVFEVKREG